MSSLLTHIRVKSEMIGRWEEIARDLVAKTRSEEPGMIRYEYWRGSEPGVYYALLSFRSYADFCVHQASDYHEGYMSEFAEMFDAISLEWIDPVQDGGAASPPTGEGVLAADAPEPLRAMAERYPAAVAGWWRMDHA